MSRYDWFRRERGLVPRLKFHVLEPCSLPDVSEFESRYGPLPQDYREFLSEFGTACLFRSPHGMWYYLYVMAPKAEASDEIDALGAVRVRIGFYINTREAWFEWKDGSYSNNGSVFVGPSGRRRKAAPSFHEWLVRSFKACRRFYTREEWAGIAKPAAPFTAREQQVLQALPHFEIRKLGIAANGNVFVEIKNLSPLELPVLTVGVQDSRGMKGAVRLSTAGIAPGTKGVREADLYKASVDPGSVELFRLPLPDPEDRLYYPELQGEPNRGEEGENSSR